MRSEWNASGGAASVTLLLSAAEHDGLLFIAGLPGAQSTCTQGAARLLLGKGLLQVCDVTPDGQAVYAVTPAGAWVVCELARPAAAPWREEAHDEALVN